MTSRSQRITGTSKTSCYTVATDVVGPEGGRQLNRTFVEGNGDIEATGSKDRQCPWSTAVRQRLDGRRLDADCHRPLGGYSSCSLSAAAGRKGGRPPFFGPHPGTQRSYYVGLVNSVPPIFVWPPRPPPPLPRNASVKNRQKILRVFLHLGLLTNHNPRSKVQECFSFVPPARSGTSLSSMLSRIIGATSAGLIY